MRCIHRFLQALLYYWQEFYKWVSKTWLVLGNHHNGVLKSFLLMTYLFIWVLDGNEEEVSLPWSFWVLLQKQWPHMTFCLLFKEAHLIFCYANAMFLDDLSLNKLRMLLGRGVWGQLGEGWISLKQIIWNSQRTNKKDLCFSSAFSLLFSITHELDREFQPLLR